MKKRWARRHIAEAIFKILMLISFVLVAGSLTLILWTIVSKGLPALNWAMLTQTPNGGYYLGKTGGILNAILGSLYMAGGGTLLALIFGLPIALYLETYLGDLAWSRYVRLALDVLWGIPSIVYGAFGFILMLTIGMRASLLGGIITLALLELPIMTRAMDEVIRMMPQELEQAALALGSTRLEVALRVVTRQMLPGIVTAVLLAFGRGIGDAASVLFTAGYTDRIPTSLLRPAASLPLAVYFQLSMPYPEVQKRAYAAALILTFIVLAVSLGSRWLAGRLNRNVIR
ncbi:MAG: phosphate ABC transporter permease PstA [Anaerolineales bacterium]|jgi:phosphate transport system permease protein